MKIQFYLLIVALVLAGCSGQSPNTPAQDTSAATAQPSPATAEKEASPATEAAKTPEEAAEAARVAQAEAFTQEQIQQSRNPDALSKLAVLYDKEHDAQRFTWTLERLTQMLPNSGNLRLQLAMAYSGSGEKARAYDTLLRLLNLGYSYDIDKDPRFDGVRGTKVWDYIVTSNQNNAKQFGEGKVAFDLPKGDTLLESIAWDPKRKQFLVGSVREGKIYLADNTGKLSDFISADATNGLYAIFAMAVDATNDKLYVISNGVPHFKNFSADMVGKTGLFEFSLSSGKFLHKYSLPDDNGKHILSSIVADNKGHVYVADGVNEQIYHLDGGALKLLTGNPVLSGIRGLALSPDGRTLYFADVSLGIFGFDLATGAPFNLAHNPDKLTLGGIDGLYWYDGTLVAIQNEMSPKRVIRLKLSADGRSIVGAMPLDAAQPAFGAPTIGTVAGDNLYFIANSQKSNYGSLGALTDASKLEPVHVFRSNLRFAWDQKGVETAPAAPAAPRKSYTPEELQQMLKQQPKPLAPNPPPASDKSGH